MTQDKTHTLLLTQDQAWVATLYGSLWQNGFAPLTIAPTADAALDLFYQVSPRLVLVDLRLPGCDVINPCIEMLLAQPGLKVVLLTENNTEPPLALLHAGIAGCIPRNLPQNALPGLLVYILSGGMTFSQNIVETALTTSALPQQHQPLLTLGALRIDSARRLVLYGGRHIRLTPREFTLLACLARNTDHVVTFEQLLNEAWGYDANDGTPAQVRLYVARLRRKLLDDTEDPDFILTERGIGYRLHSEILHRSFVRPERRSSAPNSIYPAAVEANLIYN